MQHADSAGVTSPCIRHSLPSPAFRRRRACVVRRYTFMSSALVATVGVYAFYRNFNNTVSAVETSQITSPEKLFLLRMLFGKTRSRLTGLLMETHLPPRIRAPVYSFLARLFGLRVEEWRHPPHSYESLAHVFARTLVDGARPVHCDRPDSVVSRRLCRCVCV
eukprot:GHVU01167105.1.p1 GENE.GHVU01167105.1~~GHVU01167105.1.p1  ORF type:complete len:163 (+),score=11.76 GHVU01167105.1:139-627(+)